MKTLIFILVLALFVVGQERIPTPIKTDSAKAIAEYLLSSPIRKRKGEFETTADNEKRRNDASSLTLPGGKLGNSTLTFMIAERDVNATYNADKERCWLRLLQKDSMI